MALPRAAALAALSVALLLLPATFWPVAAVVRSGRTAVPAGWGDAFGSTTGPAEKVTIAKGKSFITLQGQDALTTKIVWNDWAGRKVDGEELSTIGSCTLCVSGYNLIVNHLTIEVRTPSSSLLSQFLRPRLLTSITQTTCHCLCCLAGWPQNDHPKPSAGSTTDQAVALRITGDMAAFYNSRFIGWQDTLYDHKSLTFGPLADPFESESRYLQQEQQQRVYTMSPKLWFKTSLIELCTSYLQGCTLFAKDWGSYTAQKRMSTSEASGFVFLRSNITGSGKVTTSSPDTVQHLGAQIQILELAQKFLQKVLYDCMQALLGRAWGPAARTIYAFSFLDKGVDPSGWGVIKDFDSDKSIFFALHKCWGPGYSAAARSTYSRTLSSRQAAQFTYYSFIGASDWLGPDPPGPMWSYSFPTTSTYRPSRFNIPEAP
eukprot:SM000018S03634  [mRNA]  locus=s18:448489:450871:- [translate_table: standard]